jgi:hypothetical protein
MMPKINFSSIDLVHPGNAFFSLIRLGIFFNTKLGLLGTVVLAQKLSTIGSIKQEKTKLVLRSE